MAKSTIRGIRKVALSTPGEAEAYLSNIADCIADVTFEPDRSGFHMSYAGGSLGQCALHRGSHSAMTYKVKPSDEFHFITLQKYGLRYEGGAEQFEAAAHQSAMMLAPRSDGVVRTQSGVIGISLIAPTGAIARHVSKLTAGTAREDISTRKAATLRLADPVVTTLARNIVSVFHEMRSLGQSGLSEIACANFDELLLDLIATALSAEARKAIGSDPPGAGTALVRQARDYIRAHAAEPLRLSDLAASLGIGPRALQIGFRREVGCSPRDYLMTCRLELARERLMSADDDAKVTTVALDCGFTDLAVFSRKYREMFGELPSETFRRR